MVVINLVFSGPKTSINKHAIVFPTEMEDEERYSVNKVNNKKIKYKPVFYPKDDYDDAMEPIENEIQLTNPVVVPRKHTTEFHRNTSGQLKHTAAFHRNKTHGSSISQLKNSPEIHADAPVPRSFQISSDQLIHTTEFRGKSSIENNSDSTADGDQEDDVSFHDRFLFKTILNCKRHLINGKCSRRKNA